MMGVFSIWYLYSGINRFFILLDLFTGKYAELSFLDKFLWFGFMINAGPAGVVTRNWDYILKR